MQCWIQNGGRENAEYSGCLRCRLFCRYGCNDHARYEELKNTYTERSRQNRLAGAFLCLFGALQGRSQNFNAQQTKNGCKTSGSGV